MKYLFLLLTVTLLSCNWAKTKAKNTVNEAGQVAGKAGSEFVNGVAKGIEKTFQNEVVLSDDLKMKGVKTGKIIIHGSDSTDNNILSVYFIFDKDFNQSITIKVISNEGQEYGRLTQVVTGRQGEAKYLDYIFDKRTNIDGRGKLQIE
ncbi:MAG TPA: hypothetical protein VG052_03455 [Puia sp.]|jgi:hypothetical protein|nr:hypothetical protein [Puia sp.]